MAGSSADQAIKDGIALQTQGKLLEAAETYAALLRDDPQNADAWHLLGTIEIERRNLDNAFNLVSKALAIQPDSPVFHHNIAYIHGALGRLTEAETHYRRSIALSPGYAEAYFNLSGSAKFTTDDPIIPNLETLLGHDGFSDRDRCFLHFAAGKIYDDIGDTDTAFAHYRAGNAAKGAQTNPAYSRDYIDALIQVFDAEFLRSRAGIGSRSERPVFIVGMPRSGTSLAEQILASHGAVHGAGELADLDSIAKALPEHAAEPVSYPRCLTTLDGRHITGLADAFLRRLAEMAPAAERVVDKAPLNFRHLGLIALMLPAACVIHCRRDPLDTCLSCYFQNFARGQEYSFDLAELGRFYSDYRRLMDHWRAVLPLRIFELDYEDLVRRPEPVSRALVDFCGLDWDPACAQAHRTARSVRTASRWQVRQPIYGSSVGRARAYARHLGPLIDALGPYAEESAVQAKAG